MTDFDRECQVQRFHGKWGRFFFLLFYKNKSEMLSHPTDQFMAKKTGCEAE